MGRERRIAVLIALLLVILGVRLCTRDAAAPTSGPPADPAFAVYFASSREMGLEPEIHFGQPSLEELLQILAAGPTTPGLLPVLPPGTRILGARQLGTVLHVNFSAELMTAHPGGSAGELVTVYGIVNTLVNAPGVEQVQIWVEGRLVETIAGHVSTWAPLKPDYTLAGAALI